MQLLLTHNITLVKSTASRCFSRGFQSPPGEHQRTYLLAGGLEARVELQRLLEFHPGFIRIALLPQGQAEMEVSRRVIGRQLQCGPELGNRPLQVALAQFLGSGIGGEGCGLVLARALFRASAFWNSTAASERFPPCLRTIPIA